MDAQTPNYRREFLRGPHHAALGLLTLGLGFISANLAGIIGGVALYAIGWIYLPDIPFFRAWVDRRFEAARRLAEMQKVNAFVQRRDFLLKSLSPPLRDRYNRLAVVCDNIETASADSPLASPDPATDPRLRKLDELMWTYLRLLGIQESLERFLQTERAENVPALLKDAEAEATRLKSSTPNAVKTSQPSSRMPKPKRPA